MIETYKILTRKYDMVAVPNLSIATTAITRGNDLRLSKIVRGMICVNSSLKNAWLICGIVCLIVLCMLNLLT